MPARPSLVSIVALAGVLGSVAPRPVWAQDPSQESDPIEQAKTLYQQGSTLYSAADYGGAIEKFTEALGIITAEGSAQHATIRGALLFNIARAHANAYEVDRDASHLRAARSIFQRFIDESADGNYEPSDIDEARSELERIDEELATIDSTGPSGPGPGPDIRTGYGSTTPDSAADKQIRSTRNMGLGLTIAGAVLLPGGAGLLGYGYSITVENCREYDVKTNDASVSCRDIYATNDDTAVSNELESGVRANHDLGVGVMATGGVLLGLGAISLGVGIVQLVRAKSMATKNEQKPLSHLVASPWMGEGRAGLTLSGRF